MRQVPTVEKRIGGTTYRWTGTYLRPKKQPEHMVFVSSSSASSFKPDQMAVARSEIEVAKSRFDAAGLQIDGKHLVGIVRPPLTKPAYGLGVAIVEPTGQLRFVFSVEEAATIKARLEELRRREDIARVIERSIFIYPETK